MGKDSIIIVNHEYSGQPNTRYLSGFSGSESVLVITPKKKLIITDGRYYLQARQEAPDFTLVKHNKIKYKDSVATLERIRQMRIVKKEAELANLQKAADISITAFKRLLPLIKPGVSELWLAAHLELFMKEAGSPKAAFDTIVASGKNGAMPHAQPTTKKIKKGELVTIDFGASYNSYMSDITRTVAVGKVSPKLKEIYEVVRMSQELGCSVIKAGVSGMAVDNLCREYISESGYGKYFLHSTGHGLGMSVHELPVITSSNKQPLPVNSVVTCEPGIYIEGLGGVRIEDALIVKKNGNINLHRALTKKLIVL